jgi:hypothetical protein
MAKKPLFSVTNVHTVGCGTPPHVRQEAGRYQGYFENRYGEQWIFIFDYATDQGYLRGGDTGWDTVYALPGDGTFPAGQLPILNEEEQLWLRACVRAAQLRKPPS